MQTGMRSSDCKTRNNGWVQIGLSMLRVHRRIEKLEQKLNASVGITHVIRIDYIDNDGRVTGTWVSSNDPALCEPYREIEDDRKEPE
jgi:hypothetical protein